MAKWIAAALLAGLAAQAQSFLGKAPPELVGTKDQWINAPDGVQLAKLKGKVVWVEFGFLRCLPCKKMMPILDRWHADLASKGLVIVDVDDGAADDLDEVQKASKEHGTKYAVLWDKDSRNFLKFGVEASPRAFLVGADGNVVWEGIPSGDKPEEVQKYEAMLNAEFEKLKK